MTSTDLTIDENLSRFYQDHHPWLLSWLEKRLSCRLNAEDHAHNTFIKIIESRENAHNIREPRAYLTTIAKGLLINQWRRTVIEQAYLSKMAANPDEWVPSPEENAIIISTLQEIDNLLSELPSKVRQAFLMAQLEGLTYIEIGERIGVSDRMVKKYMARAMLHCLTLDI